MIHIKLIGSPSDTMIQRVFWYVVESVSGVNIHVCAASSQRKKKVCNTKHQAKLVISENTEICSIWQDFTVS